MKRLITTAMLSLSLLLSAGLSLGYSQPSKTTKPKVVSKPTKTIVTRLPAKHTTVKHKGATIHINNGRYYTQRGSIFSIVIPPVGLRIATIPKGHVVFKFNNRNYYSYEGVIYTPTSSGEYEVAAPVKGMIVPELPVVNVSEVEINGKTYFEFDGTLYKQIPTQEGLQYEVIGELSL